MPQGQVSTRRGGLRRATFATGVVNQRSMMMRDSDASRARVVAGDVKRIQMKTVALSVLLLVCAGLASSQEAPDLVSLAEEASSPALSQEDAARLAAEVGPELLSYCALIDEPVCIEALLAGGTPVDAANSAGTRALAVAVGSASVSAATALIAAGAVVTGPTGAGSIEGLARVSGSADLIRRLIRDPVDQATALMLLAAETGDADLLRTALDLEPNLDAVGPEGFTGCCQTNANKSPFALPSLGSGREEAAPLGESGGAGQLVLDAVLEVALGRKMVVDRGMD